MSFPLLLLKKPPRLQPRLLQQLARCACARLFHHGQQNTSCGFGIGLGVVVVELVADVRRQRAELVVWQVRPDATGEITGAEVIKLRTGQAEMIQGGAQVSDVEGCVVRDHDVGASQSFQKFRRDGREFRGIQNIQMRQPVTFNEVIVKPYVRFWRSHQPIRSLRQFAILKHGNPGGADAHAGWIGCFKIYAGEGHCVSVDSGLHITPRLPCTHIPFGKHRRKESGPVRLGRDSTMQGQRAAPRQCLSAANPDAAHRSEPQRHQSDTQT